MPSIKSQFCIAIDASADLAGKLQPGLRALRGDSSFVTFDNPRLLNGSVDIDSAV